MRIRPVGDKFKKDNKSMQVIQAPTGTKPLDGCVGCKFFKGKVPVPCSMNVNERKLLGACASRPEPIIFVDGWN